ncbi:cupin domain-containing protein, partial [Pontibacter sp. HJ8]
FAYTLPAVAQEHTTKSHQTTADHVMKNQDKLQWQDGPPGLPKGARIAVLKGDPAKEGPFAIRVSLPANYKIAPHWHPSTENVTVLKGTLYMGAGKKLDPTAATTLKEGGYAVMPAKFEHYAFTKDSVVFQLDAMGPFEITYVNPSDDPRKKSPMN